MQHSISKVRIALTVILALGLVIDISEAASRGIPPLFRDSPVERFASDRDEISSRADVDYRLPNNTEPIHYSIELWTNVHSGDLNFNGIAIIDINVLEETRTIVLHKRQLNIISVLIRNTDEVTQAPLEMSFAEFEEEREFWTLSLLTSTPSLGKDTRWTLTIQYTGSLRTDNGGFYVSTYTDVNNQIRYLATTQFESTDARHGFPCYDEPAKRATFSISIHHDASYTAISNMPVDETKTSSGLTVFQTTPIMPTYLIAYIISDFVSTEGLLNSLPQRIFSRPGTQGDQEWALVSGMLIIQRLAEYFGIPYATPKLDQVAVPDFAAGAMENWGLVTYREEYLLYNKENSTVNTQTNVANVIAHEYAHQWFGNLVAIKWWTYLWMKEGFATLFSYQADDDAYPEWDIFQMFQTSEYQSALVNDGSNNPRPMTHYVQMPSEISRLYDTISYNKGGSVLHMWQHALTHTVFKRGLNNYLNNNKYGAAEEQDLFEAIATAAKEENFSVPFTVSDMMSSWTRQGGVPLLTVERNYDDGTFTVTQRAYYNEEGQSSDKSWIIPFNYVDESSADFRNTTASHYFEGKQIKVDSKLSADKWLILNKQSTGYYRINYDENNWKLITDGLIAKPYKIHPRNRAQMIHDAYRLTISGDLSQSTLLDLMSYLSAEDQYAPWSTANSIFTTFNRYLRGDVDYENFRYYLSDMVGQSYDNIGVNDISGEQHLRKYTRTILINLACLAGIQNCLDETNNKLRNFIHNDITIEPNLKSSTYCNGLRQSEDDDFNYVFNIFLTTKDQAEIRLLTSALGCSEKQSQINKFISSSIDNTNSLRTQDRITLLSSAYSRSEVGLDTSIDFLNINWRVYGNLTSGFGGSNPLDDDIRGMSQYVVNEEQEQKLLALVQTVKDSTYVTATLETSVKANVASNFAWLTKNRDPLMNWFASYRGGAATTTISIGTIVLTLALSLLRFH